MLRNLVNKLRHLFDFNNNKDLGVFGLGKKKVKFSIYLKLDFRLNREFCIKSIK